MPEAHCSHDLLPSNFWKVPAEHEMQELAPHASAHGAQVAAPAALLKVLPAQRRHWPLAVAPELVR